MRLSCPCFLILLFLTGCGGSKNTTSNPPPTSGQFTHVYVVFPPPSGENNTHFMKTVITQPAIEG